MRQGGGLAAGAEDEAVLRVLLVDDDDVDRERLARLLQRYRQKVEIIEAASKADALAEIGVERFDLIFLDFNLPDGDGRDLLPAIREGDSKDCLLVAVTGAGTERAAADAIKAGVHEYISKVELNAARVAQIIDDGLRTVEMQSKLREAEALLLRRSLFDGLTDLPNRHLFLDRLEMCCSHHARYQSAFAVVMIDLDRFKEVNDTLGHQAGDIVLQEVGARFAALFRASDTIARLGGDEFAGILLDVNSTELAQTICEKISDCLKVPVVVDGQTLSICASIGIALCPPGGCDAATLLSHADHAMYRAKRGVHKIVAYSGQDIVVEPRRSTHAVLADLDRAMGGGELEMYYQPKVRLDNLQVVGFEALVRWNHWEQGMIAPNDFISIVEASHLVSLFTDKTIDLALAQYARWLAGSFNYRLAINVSAMMLEDRQFVPRLKKLLAKHRIPPELLWLELTETALVVNPIRARQVLEQLRHSGVSLSIDDFGAGFTSFVYLKDFGAREIKLDQSFVADLEPGSFNASLIESLSVLCKAMDVSFIAEGVERVESWPLLLQLGCKLGQGYSIARPMPGGQVLGWLAAWESQVRGRVGASVG